MNILWHFFSLRIGDFSFLTSRTKLTRKGIFKLLEFIQRNVVLDIIHKYIFRVRSKITNTNGGFNSQVEFLT